MAAYIKGEEEAEEIPLFFFNTMTDWNHLYNTTVHATSVQRFKALVSATQHQQVAQRAVPTPLH